LCFREGRFHGARCETARSESGRYRGQAEVPRAPLDFLSAKDFFLLAYGEAHKVIDVVKHGGRYTNQTIQPVEHAPMPGQEFCSVLKAELTFEGGKLHVPELTP